MGFSAARLAHSILYCLDLCVTLRLLFDGANDESTLDGGGWRRTACFSLIAITVPACAVLRLRIVGARDVDDTGREAASVFISLVECACQTVPAMALQSVNLTRTAIKLATASPLICFATARFLVWRKCRILGHAVKPSCSLNLLLFYAGASFALCFRALALALLYSRPSLLGGILLAHAVFGVCHAIDDLENLPFGQGKLLSRLEQRVYNATALLIVYPVMSVFCYIKIQRYRSLVALAFYFVVFIEHAIVAALFFDCVELVATILLACAVFTFVNQLGFGALYLNDNDAAVDFFGTQEASLGGAVPRFFVY